MHKNLNFVHNSKLDNKSWNQHKVREISAAQNETNSQPHINVKRKNHYYYQRFLNENNKILVENSHSKFTRTLNNSLRLKDERFRKIEDVAKYWEEYESRNLKEK